jgi:hypothetical protein
LEGRIIKGSWEPIISVREYNQLQRILEGSKQFGVVKITGKEESIIKNFWAGYYIS